MWSSVLQASLDNMVVVLKQQQQQDNKEKERENKLLKNNYIGDAAHRLLCLSAVAFSSTPPICCFSLVGLS